MKSETPEQTAAREARLKALCAELGLEARGSMVHLPDFPQIPPIDASVVNEQKLLQCLIVLARQQAKAELAA